jgi:hypothetical protein
MPIEEWPIVFALGQSRGANLRHNVLWPQDSP